jgi:hypothetical protein
VNTFEMTLVDDPGTVQDLITVVDGRFTYQTGQAQSLVEARLRQLPSKADVVASLADWSNGYVTVREVGSASLTGRLAGSPVSAIVAEPVGGPIPATDDQPVPPTVEDPSTGGA